ncbi:MAG: Fe-S-containing hydro-lyase [Cellulosilyticaceae bacterium]
MKKRINIPLTQKEVRAFKVGEELLLNGIMYTARDAAHKKLIEELEGKGTIPINLENIALYYAGPAPSKPGEAIGSCGPTTSGRMDTYAPRLIELGQSVMIGKGLRNQAVIESMKKYGAVYLTAIGGAGALLAKCIKSAECIAYEELGAEAIYQLTVEDFPVIVTIDTEGKNLYEIGKHKYCKIKQGE